MTSMSKLSDLKQIHIGEVIEKKEDKGLEFFRECICKTNQFSAQFILNKLLNYHRDHVNELKKETRKLQKEGISQNLVSHLEEQYSPNSLCKEFDLSTLTFIEATKIVIRMAEKDIDYYSKFIEADLTSGTQEVLKRIITQKSAYVDQLRNEYSRLVYDL